MKILLINPVKRKHILSIAPPLALATIASYIPEEYDVEIIDENISPLKFKDCDLAAISLVTSTAPRGYEIAKKYKEKGAKVIIGGIHPSMLPKEAINYCDSVIVGEAESVFKDILKDFKNNLLKKFYYGKRLPMLNMPRPRRELYKKRYLMQNLETARGCPFCCEFCSVSAFHGKTYRQRPVKDVVDEMSTIKQKDIFFVDDNLFGVSQKNEERAISLFDSVKPLNKRLSAQTSLNMADNEKVLKSASDAGMKGLFIGIESLDENNLKLMGKGVNLSRIKDYKKIIKKIHDYGIVIVGSFIFGNDFDTKDTYKGIIDFIKDVDLDANMFSFLRPLPGTRFYDRLMKEDRIIYKNYPKDWGRYDGVVFKPKNMTVEELEDCMMDALKETASLGISRFFKSMSTSKSLKISAGMFAYGQMELGRPYK